MRDILFVIWFFAPVGYANLAPILANNIPQLKKFSQPIDHGRTFQGKRILGDHKTYRGFAAGTFIGIFIAGVQMILYHYVAFFRDLSGSIDYSRPSTLLLGAALGFGALFGDSLKSFFKRQMNVAPGKSWIPFDQIDFILGGILFSLPFAIFDIGTYILIVVVMALLHPVMNILGWLLKLKSAPF